MCLEIWPIQDAPLVVPVQIGEQPYVCKWLLSYCPTSLYTNLAGKTRVNQFHISVLSTVVSPCYIHLSLTRRLEQGGWLHMVKSDQLKLFQLNKTVCRELRQNEKPATLQRTGYHAVCSHCAELLLVNK